MMARALTLARHAAAQGEVPVGAILYQTSTSTILAEGFNQREMDHDPSAHAEHLAIVAAAKAQHDWRLEDTTLVVTLEPCAMCAGLIVNARIPRLVFGTRDPKAGMVRSLATLCDDPRLNHRAAIIEGVMQDECAKVLSDFFRALRARPRSS
ncbi:MAG: tRNA adenosine(34) deaminase TadA [Phycisphaerales bacterium]